MALYGYNRAAFNGAVSGIVAGAALLFASGDLSAQGVRNVLPDSAVVATSAAGATAVRIAPGDGGFITTSSLFATPGLLQLQSAHIDVASALKGVNTEALSSSLTVFQADGVLTQAGAANAPGAWVATAVPLVDVGFASNPLFLSDCTADARVQLSGQTGFQVDGYARTTWAVGFSAESLRTALGYTQAGSGSDLTVESIKTHGGRADIVCEWTTTALPATDAALSLWGSNAAAQGVVVRPGTGRSVVDSMLQADATAVLPGVSDVVVVSTLVATGRFALLGDALASPVSSASATPTRTTFGEASLSVDATATSDARLALLGEAVASATSTMDSDGLLALLGATEVAFGSDATATGLIFENGFVEVILGTSSLIAIPAREINAQASITAASTCQSSALVNAGAPDPDSRVMRRQPQERVMTRVFTDRLMRRTA